MSKKLILKHVKYGYIIEGQCLLCYGRDFYEDEGNANRFIKRCRCRSCGFYYFFKDSDGFIYSFKD